MSNANHSRRELLALLATLFTAGCTSKLLRYPGSSTEEKLPDVVEEPQGTQLVGDYAGPTGLNYKKIEAIALVTKLDHTGSDPDPGPLRTSLLAEMQGRDVKNPNQVLADDRTSLVLVTAYLPPAVKKGDVVDVEVKVPTKSSTTSLRDGWLMPARMREMGMFNGQMKRGREEGIAQGNIVVDSIFKGEREKQNELRGRILGGGMSYEDRKLGLVVRRDDVSIETTSVIAAAINNRFHTFENGSKKGVAEAKNDSFIQLMIPARYRQDLIHYLNVVRSIPLTESAADRAARMQSLEKKLLEPLSSGKAAWELEAIGRDAVPILRKGINHADLEVKFHAAQALAYLDEPQAAHPLAEVARDAAAFRRSALAALVTIDHVQAYEGLSELLHVPSAETRYGAFRALRLRNPNDPLIKGETMRDQFTLHVVPSPSETLVHISRQERPEIVIFGTAIHFRQPQGIFAGKQIVLTATDAEQVKVSRFAPGQDDQVKYSSTLLADVIRAMSELGASYGDVIQAIHEGKKNGNIDCRVAVDALPSGNRQFTRDGSETSGETSKSSESANSAQPDLAAEFEETYVDPQYSPATEKGVWSKLTGRFQKSDNKNSPEKKSDE